VPVVNVQGPFVRVT